jgi:hypothetical protein
MTAIALFGDGETQMNDIREIVKQVDFITDLWVFVVDFALHEVEEWNIVHWYRLSQCPLFFIEVSDWGRCVCVAAFLP